MSFPETLRLLGVAIALSVVSACGGGLPDAPSPHLVKRAVLTMGTEVTLTAWTTDEPATQAAFDEVFKAFDHLDNLLSVWKAGSDVLALNAAAGEHPVRVSRDTLDVLAIAHQVSEWTDGAFDVTFGALTDVWKFDHDQDGTVPTEKQIRARLPLVNYRALILDEGAGTAFLRQKGMRVHLGGIGKGYAVDRAVALLRERGVKDFTIQAGGDLYAGGSHGDRPWNLGIADPRAPNGPPFAMLELRDRTFSTSGDYERSFMKDGVRYHHILDLSTGQPARGCRSVTLVTTRAVIADALAKGVLVRGPIEGMALVERVPGVEAVIVSATNEVLVSSGLRDRLVLAHPPTDAP